MEAAKKHSDEQRVNKPAPERVSGKGVEGEQATIAPAALAGTSISSLPTGPGTRAMRQAAVLQMQRTHGNAHVMRELDKGEPVQRFVGPVSAPPTESQTEAPAEAAAPAAAEAPSQITGPGGSVDTSGGTVDISGGAVRVNSAMLDASGVLKADTIIANTVVATSYTPGAGNLW